MSILFFFINHFFVLAGLSFLFYLVLYSGYEIVVAGILIDGYYGAFVTLPLFTIVSFVCWILANSIKRLLLLYTNTNETFS
ncbi:MAG: hypothetical protein R3B53_04495 [Candidatus Paceibacterota bacterium]